MAYKRPIVICVSIKHCTRQFDGVEQERYGRTLSDCWLASLDILRNLGQPHRVVKQVEHIMLLRA